MSDEIEAVGALATAGLAARVIGHVVPAPGAHGTRCANCGGALAGAYCSACGQPAHVHRSLLHLTEEVLHGILHFDAKGWRTLPLLVFRPGLLTRRYIEGQRTRHVSPLALFLFSVFLMFFVFSLTSRSMLEVKLGSAAEVAAVRAEMPAELEAANAAVTRAEAALAQARRSAQGVADAAAKLESAQVRQRADTVAANAVAAALALPAGASAVQASPGGSAGPDVLAKLDLATGNARIDAAIRQAQTNPEFTIYKLKNSAYKYSFLLVPISLPFLWLMFFWRPGIAMYDHAVFALYSLSFMSVLFIVMALLEPLHARSLQPLFIMTVAPLHMFMQLRETYRLDFFAALWRTAALLVVCAVVLLSFLLLTLVLTIG